MTPLSWPRVATTGPCYAISLGSALTPSWHGHCFGRRCQPRRDAVELKPLVHADAAQYPIQKASWFRSAGRWVRRAGVAVAVAAAFGLAGCDIGVGLGGAMWIPEYFACTGGNGDDAATLEVPGVYDGNTCDGKFTYAAIEVTEETTLSFSFVNDVGDANAVAHLIDPTGLAVADVVTGERPVELTLEPGRWLVAVGDADGGDATHFSFSIDLVEE
jgi:hypothetical protein